MNPMQSPNTGPGRKLCALPTVTAPQYWQWIDDHFGPMGWFTSAQKAAHKDGPEFTAGHWRKVPAQEAQGFARAVGRLAYEQS